MNNTYIIVAGASCSPVSREVETIVRLFYLSVLALAVIFVAGAIVKLYRGLNNA